MNMKNGPLAGLRVLDFGHYIAGPLAGVFLADQGAEVIQIVRPGVKSWDTNTQAALARGKHLLEADLKNPAQRQQVLSLAAECDVVLENFRPGVMERLGFGYETFEALNPAAIYVSMPGYSRHDARAQLPVWDSTISAACGLFTDLSVAGAALDLPPTFTPLSLPSVYAGLWGAISAVAALHSRQSNGGGGDRIEAPLMDAAMSAAAGVIFQIADQPARYNVPPLSRRLLDRISLRGLPKGIAGKAHGAARKQMPPFFRNFSCSDGQLLFICAIDNANHVGKLIDCLALRSEVQKLGFTFGDVLDIPPTRHNINAYRGGSAQWKKLKAMLESRFAAAPADVWAERLALAGVPAIRQRSLKEWASMPAMLESGVLAHGSSARGEPMVQPAPQVDVAGLRSSTRAASKGENPVGDRISAWPEARTFIPPAKCAASSGRKAPLAGIRVLDLANVIAGPSAGRTLAELGAEVTHVSAAQPRMGPRMNLLFGIEVNQGKRSLAVDLHRPKGQAVIHRLLPQIDVLIYNKLPEQARRMGVTPDQVHAINEGTVISAVTAYGGVNPGGWEDRPAYDPVIQALTGIMQRYGGERTPAVHGIASCIDYFTGYSAAFGALVGLVARGQGDRRLVVRTSLTRTAGWVQLPQLCNPDRPTPSGLAARGEAVLDRLYRARGGWVHVAAGPRGDSLALPTAEAEAAAWLDGQIGKRSVVQAVQWARSLGLVAQTVVSARDLRAHAALAETRGSQIKPGQASGHIVKVRHPAGEAYFAPDATWLRFEKSPRHRIAHAPTPGQHSLEILREAGYLPAEIDLLLAAGVVTEHWPGLISYLPS